MPSTSMTGPSSVPLVSTPFFSISSFGTNSYALSFQGFLWFGEHILPSAPYVNTMYFHPTGSILGSSAFTILNFHSSGFQSTAIPSNSNVFQYLVHREMLLFCHIVFYLGVIFLKPGGIGHNALLNVQRQ